MEESTSGQYRTAPSRVARRKKKRRGNIILRLIGGIFKLIFTVLVIGLLTAGLFYRTFMHYADTVLKPEMDVDLSAYSLKQSSVIYYQDKDTGEWVELQKIHGSENRTLIDYDDIPDHVVKALISIEDERFYEHDGVDWKSTARSVYDTLTGNSARGASTITQQLIKNATGEKQVTIRRKILEIFRALHAHEKYSEEDILEMYFNLVYFGHNAYGIEAAAETYFGKSVGELTVAEAAAIVGITQNPWQYDPLRSDWSREQNRKRQLTVLYKMNELGYLNDSEYIRAKNEKMVFVGDEDYVETAETEGETAENTPATELDSFFVEQVFRDVIAALMDGERGYSYKAATDLLYNGGYKIYCTLDPEIQEIIERVYADQNNFNYKSAEGEMLQSGMTVINNQTHNIVAIAGRVGERKGALEWSYAASTSPCGSAIKPLSVYAPAIDAGILSAASVIDDYPVTLGGDPWPVNAYTGYRGLLTIQDALRISSNTTAVRTLERLTTSASYAFMTEKLGFTTLASDDISAAGALALGGLTNGVSTVEMAAAYSTFANNGIYTRPRTFLEVRDSYGNIVIDNREDSWVAMKESTVYTMNELLKNVVKSGGTGSDAAFSGMTMAGKTGTTNSRRDRYFVGYTPYYTAACWCGFPHPSRINTNDNPAVIAWRKVMEPIHQELPDKDFPTSSEGMVRVNVCNKTGLLAGSGCSATRSVLVPQGSAPALTCDAHIPVNYCTVSDALATPYCPGDEIETHWVVDLSQPRTAEGFGYQRKQILRGLSGDQYDSYAREVEAGQRDSIPGGFPLLANDSTSLLSDLLCMPRCQLHLYPPEAEPETEPESGDSDSETQTPSPDNPDAQTETPGGTETEPPAEGGEDTSPETEPVDNSNAEYLDHFLNLTEDNENNGQ